jgi:protein MpaA
VLDERPHCVIVAHAWRNDHFINFDGPAQHLAELFSRHSGYRVKPSDKIAPTPGSLGSWVGRTLGLPILTLEYERGSDPRQVWLDTRAAILAVILAS